MKSTSNKKILVYMVTLLVMISSIFLSACKPDDGKTGTGVYGGVDISKLTTADLTMVSHFDPGITRDKTSLGVSAKWWKDNTGGTVNLKVIAADIYPTKIMAMIGAGTPPDIIMVDQRGWMPRLAVLNVLEPVDDYVDKTEMMDYEQRLYDSFTWKGKHFAAYVAGAWGYALWYNKTMFVNNGLKTPREYWDEGNWNWDTFLEVAQELTQDTDKDGKTDQWGYANWGVEVFPAANNAYMTKTNDDGTVDVVWDSKEFVASAQFEADLINKYKVWSPELGFHVQNFKAGKVAMSAGANDFVVSFCKDMKDEVDNAPFPLGPDQDPDDIKYVGYSLFMGLGKGSKNLDGARAFLAVMRGEEKKLRESDVIDPESNLAFLTQEQIDTCNYVDSRVVLNYESGFGNWEANRWNFWGDILFQGVPVATALEMYKPLLEKEIKDTLESVFVEVKPFTPVPAETFESADLANFILTADGLPESSAGITAALATGADALDGTTSLKISYPAGEEWKIFAKTNSARIELPSYHRYIIKFDYLVQTSGPLNIYMTIRPEATIESDEVSYGFNKVTCTPGTKGSYEGFIDVLESSAGNVLVFITENNEAQITIDNLSITEG
ncbi:MAG: ABC transporter substrate-binding protein [Saccharofermentanales bacterium]